MGENGKTVAYIGVALLLGLVTILARPREETLRAPDIVGKPLFESFSDPTKAANLEIVRYAEDLGEVQNIEVAKNSTSGAWTIPSHGNYPADAQDQMKEAANALIGLTVLGVASEDQQDHQLFGVLEPNKEKLKLGDKGVGLLVSFKDEKGEALGRLIVGQQVKGTTDQRFVRVPNQDAVYVVKIDPTKLSTKFEDWIEKDLLKLSTFDVERLRLKDYSVLPTTQGYSLQPRSEISVSYNATDAKWKLDEMVTFKGKEAQRSQLLEGEELNKEKLDDVKNSLDDVMIVDVFPKPKGLGASLKASGELAQDVETRRSLEARGFILDQNNELFSANGELHVLLKDGVEYVLRFGNVAGEQEDSKEGKLNRYLFVTARVDESKFPAPQLEPLPGEGPEVPSPDAPAKAAEKPAASGACGEEEETQEAPQDAAKSESPASQEPAAADKAADAPAGAAKPAEGQAAAEKSAQEKPAEAKPAEAKPAEAKPAEAKPAEEKPAEEKPAEAKPAEAKPAGEKPAGEEKKAAAGEAKADPQASEEELKKKKLEAERERITKENQRKLDEWKGNKTKAEEKVRELNGRFGDWYYVISEDVYKKLHLGRSDIVKEGAASTDEGTGVDAFRKLEQGGLKKGDTAK